ncbi:helix-turn-helix domain-containing protein [Coraliomargarita sp. SDUM461004]|uniref:Helix-turn-helix domain-containing protein n=1 Tax=Thalassobacterium sedimentorum TaxID=3041258 RepID=A0ABU1AF27_9BACT|nr:helix-turn-helix domain-containing protein [Coraliomargarita sp. SDUM461004]MDQ8193381.1 helix-turn-helix domain-containing protein [Coraliomargarita sp. SDUM461004]
MNDTKQNLIPSRQVMARLGYTNRASFLEFIKREGLPFYRLGARRIVFDPDEVEAWLERHRVGGIHK